MSTRLTKRSSRRGYTAVEILSALTLFAIGAAGVLGMQKMTVSGGADARRFDIANNIAQEWTARLERDSMFWTLPNSTNTTTTNLATDTKWLKQVGGPCTAAFCLPLGAVPTAGNEVGMSPAFDLTGRDVAKNSGDHYFCVQYRLQWVADPQNATCSGSELCVTGLMRAEVRVFWQRLEYGILGNCEALPVAPDTPAGQTRYHFLYATTAIRENARQQ